MKEKIDQELKKTVLAHGTTSEDLDEHATEKMIQKEMKRRARKNQKAKRKKIVRRSC
jgi:hypothetical protein